MRFPTTAVLLLVGLSCASQDLPTSLVLPAQVQIPAAVDLNGDFTLRCFVRMEAPVPNLPALVTNKAWQEGEIKDYTTNNSYGLGRESGNEEGFAISVLPDGAWTWNAGDGRRRLDHRPEAADQGIADGLWHEVGFAIDRDKSVAHLFHDGRRVAVHDLSGLEGLGFASKPIQLGSPTASGIEIANLRIEAGVLPTSAVATSFTEPFGEARKPVAPAQWDGEPLRILAWNIWHGGRRKGQDEGVQRVVEIIQECDADIILMQETYGSGPRISGRLGYDYYLRSSNLSVMSRFPITDVHRLGPSFRFGGVTVELQEGLSVQAYSLWINYLPSVSKQLAEGVTGEQLAVADQQTRGAEMDAILAELLPHLEQTPDMPVIVGGDFNSGSHLDWTEEAAHLPNHQGLVVPWPAGMSMAAAGFVDTFRTAHPDPVAEPGRTWSPEFRDSHQDRIDYVYLRGSRWQVLDAEVLDQHARGWPSDHAAVLTTVTLGD